MQGPPIRRRRLNPARFLGLSRKATEAILRNTEAQDAMSLALTTRLVAEILRGDDIWRYWMQRDLAWMMRSAAEVEVLKATTYPYTDFRSDIEANHIDAYDALPEWLGNANPQPKDTPLWKTYYLWHRLAAAAWQWNFVREFTSGRYKRAMSAFPPESHLRYVRLNTLALETPSDITNPASPPVVMELDFAEQLARMAPALPRGLLQKMPTTRREWLFRVASVTRFYETPNIVRFFKTRYPAFEIQNTSPLGNLYGATLHVEVVGWLMQRGVAGNTYALFRDVADVGKSLLARVPRMVEQTRILVACRACGEPTRLREKTAGGQPFCGVSCQRSYYTL